MIARHFRWISMCFVALASSQALAQSLTGDIFVQAEQDGAPIFIDGGDTGLRSPDLVKGLELGEHEVGVQTDCGMARTIVRVESNRISRAELDTPVGMGTLRLLPDPAGADIYLDGQIFDEGEPFATLDCGLHRVEVKAPGHASQVREIRVAASSHQELAITLQAVIPGTLVVEVYPLSATVFLDGTEVARGPVTLEPVSVGKHVLMATADGYAQYTEVVEVADEGVTRVQLELQLADTVATPVATRVEGSPGESPGPVVVTEPASTTGTEEMDMGSAPALTSQGAMDTGMMAGVGMTVLGLGASGFAVYQYTLAAEAFQRYEDEADDAKAQGIWDDELVPAQRKMLGSGIVGGVSLLTGGIVWVRSSDTAAVSVGLGPRRVEVSGKW